MLLYTKRALPKAPKKRSRAGCEFCRVKKKKCDESRPVCARCEEAGQQCVYGPLRPRQRRSAAQIEADSASAEVPFGSTLSLQQAIAEDSECLQPALDDSWPSAFGDDDGDEFAMAMNAELCEFFDFDMIPPPKAPALPNAVAKWSPTHRHAGAFYATPHLELNMPLFSEYTTIKGRRGLLDHFSNVLSHLIVLREDESNPFQQLVLPLSRQSPAVASAIYALSSAHLECRGVAGVVEKRSIEFHSEAARNLANLIERGAQGHQNELLAAVMLLVYYEVLVHRERSQIVNGHLKGAMAILNSGPAPTDPTRAFLERAFRFYDVIAALSFRTSTLSAAPAPDTLGHFLPVDSRGASQPAGSADALLGMATSLWPVVHRLSNLGVLKDQVVQAESSGQTKKAEELRIELETTASAIETSLMAWEPELIYGKRREDRLVQEHTHASLEFCVGTVESPGPMGALLWPLFVAACEAQTPADRTMATTVFESIGRHQGMANIEHAWRIVQEVWRRADDGARARTRAEDEDGGMAVLGAELQNSSLGAMRGPEFGEEDLWRQVCKDLELAVVFG
ncbi:hypothetical protein LLEC1_06064 [Akanthomyces lecanii]|uniref:Zn(2)-C6 fungal-type domain-containing protein n=1 Tax=Cordyceps confragosa TaxID=2714763 RepID=A0A179I8I3_CORDF|nr:hypothetical protein LLEC1_06064 [Akanthomyces lecanii]